jgi:ubiquinone/menaquinone biosynthesis C-methylase UbiE
MGDFEQVKAEIRSAYDDLAAERAATPRRAYREHVLFAYADLLRSEGRSSLVELGAGAGQDAMVFHEAGFDVLATDLSPQHVEECRKRGLRAEVADFSDLRFADDSVEAALALSTFLHVPDSEIDAVLTEVRRVLQPGAPLGVGLWWGADDDGEWREEDPPHRFFSIRTDDAMKELLARHFEVGHFETTPTDDPARHYQWAVVRA